MDTTPVEHLCFVVLGGLAVVVFWRDYFEEWKAKNMPDEEKPKRKNK